MKIKEKAKEVIKEALVDEIKQGNYTVIDNTILIDISEVLAEAIDLCKYGKYYTIAWSRDTRNEVARFINSLEFEDFQEFLDWLEIKEEELVKVAREVNKDVD